jgi:hypothetical protein
VSPADSQALWAWQTRLESKRERIGATPQPAALLTRRSEVPERDSTRRNTTVI